MKKYNAPICECVLMAGINQLMVASIPSESALNDTFANGSEAMTQETEIWDSWATED